jgi:hypothetical protein
MGKDKVDRFDLEKQMMKCWMILDDLDEITTYMADDPKWLDRCGDAEYQDELVNKYFGIKEVYSVKFQKMWDIMTKLIENKDLK